MHCVNELCHILIISIFNFLIFIHFANQIPLKQSLAQKLNLILKFSSTKTLTDISLWTDMKHNGRRKDGRTFLSYYTFLYTTRIDQKYSNDTMF